MEISLTPTENPAKARRVALLAVRITISGAALWLAFGAADLGEVARSMAAAGVMPIAMTLGVYLVGQVLSALRWLMIARSIGFALRPSTSVTYYFIGMFFNCLGPSLLGGDVARSLYLARGRERMAAAAATAKRLR